MNLLCNVISSEIIQKGRALTSLGINEYAWDKNIIKEVLEELSNKKIGVLGGDVYRINDEKIEVTFDSWYMNNDGADDFYEKSIKKTLNYIQKYEKDNGDNFLYSICI